MLEIGKWAKHCLLFCFLIVAPFSVLHLGKFLYRLRNLSRCALNIWLQKFKQQKSFSGPVVSKDPQKAPMMGQRKHLSYYDRIELNLLYKCYSKPTKLAIGQCIDLAKSYSCEAGKYKGLCASEDMRRNCKSTCGLCK